jgi:hypothetical protein
MILLNACLKPGRASQSCGLAVLLSLALVASVAAADPIAKPPANNGLDGLIKLLQRPYKYLFEGATRDGARYQALATRYQQRVQELRARRVEERQVLPLVHMGWLCQRQSDNHQRLLQGLEQGKQAEARQAMANILFLETEMKRFEDASFGREWLSFQEVEYLERLGQKPRRGEPGVLPYQRALWAGTEGPRAGGGK